MNFSQNKTLNQPVEVIPTKDRYKVMVNKALIIPIIIFTLFAASFLLVPQDTLEQLVNIKFIITILLTVLAMTFFIRPYAWFLVLNKLSITVWESLLLLNKLSFTVGANKYSPFERKWVRVNYCEPFIFAIENYYAYRKSYL